MNRFLAWVGISSSPVLVLVAGGAIPKVLGILLALLQLGSNIGFGTLVALFLNIFIVPGFFPTDFVFLL